MALKSRSYLYKPMRLFIASITVLAFCFDVMLRILHLAPDVGLADEAFESIQVAGDIEAATTNEDPKNDNSHSGIALEFSEIGLIDSPSPKHVVVIRSPIHFTPYRTASFIIVPVDSETDAFALRRIPTRAPPLFT